MLLSKFIKGYTENVVILLYVNYTLMGIFKIIKQLEFRKKTSGCDVNDPISRDLETDGPPAETKKCVYVGSPHCAGNLCKVSRSGPAHR